MKNNFDRFKFRAKLSEVDGGGYVYGYVSRQYGKVFIEDAITHDRFIVEEENIDQLVGTIEDADGLGFAEVYQDDPVIVENGHTCYASIMRFLKTEKNLGIHKDADFTETAKRYGWKAVK